MNPTLVVDLALARGWCTLTLDDSGSRYSLTATNLVDALADLAQAVADLAGGRLLTSCLWPGEPGGNVIDFCQLGRGQVTIAVHEMANADWVSTRPWFPDRGSAQVRIVGDRHAVQVAFARALRRLRNSFTGDVHPEWGWPFPDEELRSLERALRPAGYRPPGLRDG